MSDINDYIKLYLSKNISFFPLFPSTKAPIVKHTEYYSRMPTEEEIRKWQKTYFNPDFWRRVWAEENDELKKLKLRWLEALQTEFKKIGRNLSEYKYEGEINIAVCGGYNDLLLVDIEDARKISPDYERLLTHFSPFVVKTGKEHGYHVYFKCHFNRTVVGKNGEIRAYHTYVVAPPSRHPNGKYYHFLLPLSELEKKEIEEVTEQFVKEVVFKWIEAEEKKEKEKQERVTWNIIKEELKKLPAVKGKRSDWLFVTTLIAKMFFTKPEEAFEEIKEIPICADKIFEKKEPYDWWFKYEWCDIEPAPRVAIPNLLRWAENQTQLKLSEDFYKILKENIKREEGYGHELTEAEIVMEVVDILNRQIVPDEKGRTTVLSNYLDNIAREICFMLFIATPAELDEIYIYKNGVYEQREWWLKKILQTAWSVSSLKEIKPVTDNKISEIIKAIRKRTYVPLSSFNPDGYICLKNGIYNIKKFQFEPHNPKILFLSRLDVEYNPTASSQEWEKFLDEVVDKKYHKVLYEFIGYCFLKDCRFEKALLLVGQPASGKSTFLTAVRAIFGKYASSFSIQQLENERFVLGSLIDKFVNIYNDLPRERLVDSAIFKQLVSGDSIAVEIKFKQPFTYTITTKLIFAANQLPETVDKSGAFYRRLIIIPFKDSIPPDKRDPSLKEKLQEEHVKSYIFNKAIEALKELLQKGRFSYEMSEDEIAEIYEKASDPVAFFVDTHVVQDDTSAIEPFEAYRKFVEFCRKNELIPVSFQQFVQKMHLLIPIRVKRSGGKRKWVGIRIENVIEEVNNGE